MGLENLWKKCKKRFWSKKCLVQKIWVKNEFNLDQKSFGSKEILSLKKFGFKKFASKQNYH